MAVKIKICGIRTPAEALGVAEAGADAVGLMFVESSPRRVTLAEARAVAERLPLFVFRVGVFADAPMGDVVHVADRIKLDAIQLHGDESPDFCGELRRMGYRVIKAFRVRGEETLAELGRYDVDAWLLDSYVPGVRGGTGASFNWMLARKARDLGVPVLLAGGLVPGNVADAIRQVGPFGVDVSSGVEASPGVKDLERVQAFCRAVRQMTLSDNLKGSY